MEGMIIKQAGRGFLETSNLRLERTVTRQAIRSFLEAFEV
jgi:hypothetical protein